MVEMEQVTNSLCNDSVIKRSTVCLDRKRKLQAEQLGIPPSKHPCGSESESESESLGHESAESSKSIVIDTDSFMSTLYDAEINESHSKEYASYSCGLYSLAASSSSGPERSESVVYTDIDDIDNDLGVHLPMNIEEHVLELGGHGNGCCLECNKRSGKKELEQLLYVNEVTAKSSVLASGEWTVDNVSKGNTKKLTIDKEFENYFSALML